MEELKSQIVEEAISIIQAKVNGRGSDLGSSNGTREEGRCVTKLSFVQLNMENQREEGVRMMLFLTQVTSHDQYGSPNRTCVISHGFVQQKRFPLKILWNTVHF